jgi:Kef-type K+ transport system membrane component KefB
MRKVLWYSLLLTAGLIGSQLLDGRFQRTIELLTLFCLSFVVVHLGYGFEIARDKPKVYLWDSIVGATTTVFPWLFCAIYFVFAMAPRELWWTRDQWWEAVLLARFAAPTSVGLLFSMLAAAGLSVTWLYKKARVLAIFDDLDTILLFIPLKTFLTSMNMQLVVLVIVIFGCLWVAWKYMRCLNLPVAWPWVMIYSAIIVAVSKGISLGSKAIDEAAPIKVEVLLLGFVLGCLLARSPTTRPGVADSGNKLKRQFYGSQEKRVSAIVCACFMALAGLSMPLIVGHSRGGAQQVAAPRFSYEGIPSEILAQKEQFPGWDTIAIHVVVITLLSNIGKMFPALCYRKEASRKERLALGIGMFPRGEVGAGMLVLSLSYGIAGPALTVAVLSLGLNLLCSGLFIAVIKKLVPPKAELPETPYYQSR